MKEIKNDLGNIGEMLNYCEYVSSSGEKKLKNDDHEFINTYVQKNSILIPVEVNRSNYLYLSALNVIDSSSIF